MLAVTGLGLVGGGLGGAFLPAAAGAAPAGSRSGRPAVDGYGPLSPAGKELALPAGFGYRTFGAAGSRMSDGLPTPGCHDGQAVFVAGRERVRIIRNHEIDLDVPGARHQALGPRNAYDRGRRPGAPRRCTTSDPGGSSRASWCSTAR
ncbi:hypothetical protein GCM10010170_106560 [Dactylosporangium salmoneum]|uniref:Uncharacterized protein n=1 Tax=Dactylosporangium salmoneum TaxID=53361 RepID=A0ABN3I3Q7_9ACTN